MWFKNSDWFIFNFLIEKIHEIVSFKIHFLINMKPNIHNKDDFRKLVN